jgi:hypothetical protein
MSVFHQMPRIPLLEQIRQNLARKNQPPTVSGMGPNFRNITHVGTGQITINSNAASQISLVSGDRIATKITNLSQADIYYGTTPSVSQLTGDLLPGGRGKWVLIAGASVVWVIAATSAGVLQTATISFAEYF